MNDVVHIPELLAPAGTIEAGLAALDAGADAVYAGLDRFNARERGQNLNLEEMSKLITYAHRIGRNVYVTLNTLVKEAEFPAVTDMLGGLDLIRPDAIIVQDIGVVRLIREGFPHLTMHASTQMGIHNSAGVRVAESMGIKRVILQRQITFDEIARIREETAVELEVFIHGALCCGRSGGCLFSSWMGGWSGNRGKCKQPCRRRYFSDSGNGFFFSTKDLYSLEEIPRLKTLGVQSLKIEGRLRRADYVESVVSAYRHVLDAGAGQIAPAIKHAKGILTGAPGRRWTPPFRTKNDFRDVIQHSSLGASGLLCGSVTRSGASGFLMEVTRPLHVADAIRIQPRSGDEGPAITITKMSLDKKSVKRVKRGNKCWIHCDKHVETGSRVFKTGRATPGIPERVEALPPARIALDFDINITQKSVEVLLPTIDKCWRISVEFLPARTHPLNEFSVCDQFGKSDATEFCAGAVTVSLPDGLFLPAAHLKRVRKSFWNWVEATLDAEDVRTARSVDSVNLRAFLREPLRSWRASDGNRGRGPDTVRMSGGRKCPIKGALTATLIGDVGKHTDEAILPEFCSEGALPSLRNTLSRVADDGTDRFRITSLYALDMLPAMRGGHIAAGFPLPVCNSLAMAELAERGVETATAWVELDKDALDDLIVASGGRIEVFKYGRIPILSTRMEIPVTGRVTDGRGAEFEVLREDGLTRLYPRQALSVAVRDKTPVFIDLLHARLGEKAVTAFNQPRDWV